MDINALSMHSMVFSIDTSLSSSSEFTHEDKISTILFPNPVKSMLELHFPKSQNREISIYQYNGSRVYKDIYPSSKNLSIDLSFLPAGLYILESLTNQGQKTFKFIIEN
jgi:hypothetical protein